MVKCLKEVYFFIAGFTSLRLKFVVQVSLYYQWVEYPLAVHRSVCVGFWTHSIIVIDPHASAPGLPMHKPPASAGKQSTEGGLDPHQHCAV